MTRKEEREQAAEEFIDYLEKRYEGKFATYEVTIRNIIFKE